MEIVCALHQHYDTIISRLTISQADVLNSLIDEYNSRYYRTFPSCDVAQIPNGKRLFTNHEYEVLSILDIKRIKDVFMSVGKEQRSPVAPVIMHMNFGNRMCYVVKEEVFFNNKDIMAPYIELNKFVFGLLCDKLKERDISNRYTKMEWPL